MVCFSPQRACRSVSLHKSGKNKIVFLRSDVPPLENEMLLKCGQCIGCRIAKSREWALRCMHEASLSENNSFITLTYRTDCLPPNGGLDHRDWQLFMYRFRKAIRPDKVRFYMCGEYGDKNGRPHFHACIFGYDFPDRVKYKTNPNGDTLYTSEFLDKIWGFGMTTVGLVTFQSAAYCARYSMKKVLGDKAEEHYQRWNPETGEIIQLRPEYNKASNRGGIGKDWFDKFKDDVYPGDFVVDSSGRKHKPPSYYDRKYEELFPDEFLRIKELRCENAKKHVDNNTPERLLVREECLSIKLNKLQRNHDKDFL